MYCLLQLTDQKIAMEMMLGELGVSAKTNLVKVQCLFDTIDKDGSGDIDGDELTRAQPHCTGSIKVHD
jgi:Ca2+-binding EF-hand superfamily protein